MDTKTLSQFIAWSKTTDLQEIIYKKPGSGGRAPALGLEIKAASAMPQASDFSTKLIPVPAPAVGIYHGGKKGREIILKEEMPVKKGDFMGIIEMNKTQKEVAAPTGGILKIIGITDGQPAEYGQPLFFIEPENDKKI